MLEKSSTFSGYLDTCFFFSLSFFLPNADTDAFISRRAAAPKSYMRARAFVFTHEFLQ